MIIVVGSVNWDYSIQIDSIPQIGETKQSNFVLQGLGGKGANQAIALANFNTDVNLCACIGKDDIGKKILTKIASCNIDTKFIKEVQDETGSAFVVVESDGHNRIIVNSGANHSPELVKTLDTLDFTSIDYLITQCEVPKSVWKKALEISEKNNVISFFNPSPISSDVTLEDCLNCDYVILNEIEASCLVQKPVSRLIPDYLQIANLMSNSKVNVIITLGEKGVVWKGATDDVASYIPSLNVKPVDTSGAGDAFLGGLVYGITKKIALKEAIHFANATGAYATTQKGASLTVTENEIIKLMEYYS